MSLNVSLYFWKKDKTMLQAYFSRSYNNVTHCIFFFCVSLKEIERVIKTWIFKVVDY